MNDKNLQKIEKFFNNELLGNLDNVSIFKNNDGSYEIFNRYYILPNKEGYKITMKHLMDEKTFSSLKNAVTWCIFDSRNKINQANRIEYLDRMISGISVSISMHKKLINTSIDLENKLIYISKLSQEEVKRKQMLREITSYVNESSAWQTKKFATK